MLDVYVDAMYMYTYVSSYMYIVHLHVYMYVCIYFRCDVWWSATPPTQLPLLAHVPEYC